MISLVRLTRAHSGKITRTYLVEILDGIILHPDASARFSPISRAILRFRFPTSVMEEIRVLETCGLRDLTLKEVTMTKGSYESP